MLDNVFCHWLLVIGLMHGWNILYYWVTGLQGRELMYGYDAASELQQSIPFALNLIFTKIRLWRLN